MMANKLVPKLLLIGPMLCLVTREGTHSISLMSSIFDSSLGLHELALTTFDEFLGNLDPSALEATSRIEDSLHEPDEEDQDIKRNVSGIIESRGFQAVEYDVVTDDGYILTIHRIVNPLIDPKFRKKLKPVILQHGLLSSSFDWVINSLNVKPIAWPLDGAAAWQAREAGGTNESQISANHYNSQDHPNSLGFYLANIGFDVFLANSRGNMYGMGHTQLSAGEPKFWDFTFDEQIEFDLPSTIAFIQRLSGHTKLAYVGHSQGSAMAFGLLSERPEYSDILEPVVALAPVAYVNNCISPTKYFSVVTPVLQHVNAMFATNNMAVKWLGPKVCKGRVVRREICANILFLTAGINVQELDDSRIPAYMAHVPAGTSIKNIAHYGQEVISGRFAKFDRGISGNRIKYGHTENDWLASPKDVARLRAELKVEPYAVYNMTEFSPEWNHIDFVYGKRAGKLINTRIAKLFQEFRALDDKNPPLRGKTLRSLSLKV